jgi:hypothetical protein
MLCCRAFFFVVVVAFIHVVSVASAVVTFLPFSPRSWTSENFDVGQVFRHATDLANNSFTSDIHECVRDFAYRNKLIFTTRGKAQERFEHKFRLAQETIQKYGILNSTDGQELKSKAFQIFEFAFMDMSRCRIAPVNGEFIDVANVTNSLIVHLDTCLQDNRHKPDDSWTQIVSRVNNTSMFRLFINLFPEAAKPDFITIRSEIQIIASSDIAVSFTANSESTHSNRTKPFPSPFSLREQGAVNGTKLAKYMSTPEFTIEQDTIFKKFEVCENFEAFRTFFKESKQAYGTDKLQKAP